MTRVRAIHLLLLLGAGPAACGDDDGSAAGDGGADAPLSDAAADAGPGIDAPALCVGGIADGGAPPNAALGSGWARGSSGLASALASIVRAGDGSFFLAGRVAEGDLTLGGQGASASGPEAFVARLAANGSPQWLRATSGTGDVSAAFHAAAAGDGVAFGGGFQGSLTLNPGTPSAAVVTTDALEAPWIARWSGDGGLDWAETGAATGSARVFALGAVGGDVLACGELSGALTLGSGGGQTDLTATDVDAWLARFGTGGALAFAVRLGDAGADTCRAVAGLADGSALVGAMLAGEGVIARVDAAGAPGFTTRITGTDVEITDLSPFADGAFVVSGLFSGSATFAAGSAAEVTLPAPPGAAGFVARYAADGTLAWARLVTRAVNGVAARADGSVWGVGSSLSPGVVLNECQPDRLSLTMFDEDAFLARWDAAGRLTYATQQGNYYSQFGVGVADVPGVGAAIAGTYVYGAIFYSGTGSQVMFQDTSYTNPHVFVLGINAP